MKYPLPQTEWKPLDACPDGAPEQNQITKTFFGVNPEMPELNQPIGVGAPLHPDVIP